MLGCLFKFVFKLLARKFACGEVVVSSGSQELFVSTGFTPAEVYLELGDFEGGTGCNPISDGFDARKVPEGFILISNISSKKRNVSWKAIG